MPAISLRGHVHPLCARRWSISRSRRQSRVETSTAPKSAKRSISIAARICGKKQRRLIESALEVTQALRVVAIYGDGSAMLLERHAQEFARANGSRAEVIEPTGVRREVSPEAYVGAAMVDGLVFAREREGNA